MFQHRALFVVLFLLLVNGCTTPPKPLPVVNNSSHQLSLDNFNSWQINGRMAFKSKDEKFSANLRWQQDKQDFQIKLTSTFGISMMEMQVSPNHAELIADDNTYQDRNANRLIRRVTGWNIPMQQLPTWIKGQFFATDTIEQDKQGLLKSLQPNCKRCDQWQIQYAKYKLVDNIWLPHQIELANKRVPTNQIKIRISSWKKR